MIGSNLKVIVGMMSAHFISKNIIFAMCLSSLFHNLLVDMLLGIIILLWIFLDFFEIQNISGIRSKNRNLNFGHYKTILETQLSVTLLQHGSHSRM